MTGGASTTIQHWTNCWTRRSKPTPTCGRRKPICRPLVPCSMSRGTPFSRKRKLKLRPPAAGMPARMRSSNLTGRRPQTIWIHEAALSVGYELDYLGRVRRSVESARADAEAVAAAQDSVKITVAAETARAYAQICALGEQLEVARHSLEIVSREADITVNRNEAGANSRFDVVRAQGLVAQVRASIPPLEGQRRSALFQLAALLGRTPTMAPTEVNQCVTPPRLTDLIPVGDGATLLKRRPDVRQADRRMASATARIGVATADLYPQITLKASIRFGHRPISMSSRLPTPLPGALDPASVGRFRTWQVRERGSGPLRPTRRQPWRASIRSCCRP